MRRARRKSRVMPITVGVVLAALLGWWGWQKTHPATGGDGLMITAPVSRGDLVETITATGSVNPQTGAEVHIGSQITGTIQRLYADVGTHVHAGQVIAVLNLPDINAQLAQSKANYATAAMKLAQDETGLGQTQVQTASAINQSLAALNGSNAQFNAATADSSQQNEQTTTDINRAQANVAVAQAALSTAESTKRQTDAGAQLQVNTAQAQLAQAKANATNSSLNLKRQQSLLSQGFASQATVDAAQAQATSDQQAVVSAQQNLGLVQQKVQADIQTTSDAVTQARQNLTAAKAALTAAKAEVYANYSKQAAVRNASAAVRQAQASYTTALANRTNDVIKQQDIQASKDAAAAALQQVNYEQAQFNKTIIRTPISGTVLQLAAQQGETLAAGLSAPTVIIVADLNRLQIDAFVDETDIGKVRLGQPASCTVDAYPNHIFHGVVQKIASGSTIQQGVVTYDVTIKIENPRGMLKPDMTANVTIEVGRRRNVLLVPSEAVQQGMRGATVSVVTKVNGKEVITPHRVQVGGSDGVNTEILSGLKDGDIIVRAGGNMGNGPHFGPQNPFGPSNNNRNQQNQQQRQQQLQAQQQQAQQRIQQFGGGAQGGARRGGGAPAGGAAPGGGTGGAAGGGARRGGGGGG